MKPYTISLFLLFLLISLIPMAYTREGAAHKKAPKLTKEKDVLEEKDNKKAFLQDDETSVQDVKICDSGSTAAECLNETPQKPKIDYELFGTIFCIFCVLPIVIIGLMELVYALASLRKNNVKTLDAKDISTDASFDDSSKLSDNLVEEKSIMEEKLDSEEKLDDVNEKSEERLTEESEIVVL